MAIVEIKPQVIKEIAEYLEVGMVCFYHKTNGELVSLPDPLRDLSYDGDKWQEDEKKVKKNSKDYLKFEGMTSRESFRIMEDFVEQISHQPTRDKFIEAITRKKPFAQFKNLMGYYGDLEDEWFAYKLKREIEFVNEQLEAYNL